MSPPITEPRAKATPLVEKARDRLLKFLGHILRLPVEEPSREYAFYVPTYGKRKPGWQQTLVCLFSFLSFLFFSPFLFLFRYNERKGCIKYAPKSF